MQLFDSTRVFESAVNLNLSTHADPENDSMIVTRFYSHKDLKFAPTMFIIGTICKSKVNKSFRVN